MTSKFQRRHYEEIAKTFKDGEPVEQACEGPTHYKVRRVQWVISIGHITIMFYNDNPSFDTARFREACGL